MYYYYYLLFLANPTHLPLKLKLNNICRIIISTKPTLFLNLFFYVFFSIGWHGRKGLRANN